LIHLFIFAGLLIEGCKKDSVSLVTPPSNWIQVLSDWHFNGDEIYVGARVEENELRLVSIDEYKVIDANGQLEDNSGFLLPILNPIGIKPVLNRTYIVVSDQYNTGIEFIDYKCGNYSPCKDGLGFSGTQNYKFMKDFTGLNPGKDVGAMNMNDGFLTSAVRTGYTGRISLLFVPILGSHLRYQGQATYIHPDEYNFHKILLPNEGDAMINRIQSFINNFFVSTGHFSYLVRPDGSFKQVFNRSAREFFQYHNQVYADFGDAIYASSDDGENWNLIYNHHPDMGFRQFFTVNDSLCFFRNDSIFVMHLDFTSRLLNNTGIQGDEITSVNEFIDKVYITTLSGIFYKPRNDFFK
jgi:hypothetical protein